MDRLDEDGLPASEVGIWTLEKHERLRRYITASHGARRRFGGRTSFIDLYCGPGRSWIRDNDKFIDGGLLVAFEAGRQYGDQFGEFHIADVTPGYVDAANKRLVARSGSAKTYVGAAADTVVQVTTNLHPNGLHFAFLDPFNLTELPLSVIKELAHFKHMDILIHVSVMHWTRELPKWLVGGGASCDLDPFAPGWRDNVDTNRRQEVIRKQIFEYWCGEIRKLNMITAEHIATVENSRGGDLYWLVLVTRHQLANLTYSSA